MSNPFDQFDAPAAEGGNPFDQFDAPAAKKLPSKGILSDVGGAFVEGAKSAGRAIAGTANIYAGDESALVEKAQAQESAQAQKPAALTAFNQAVTERVKPLGDDPGLLDSVKAIGGAVVDQPKGAGLAVVEQLPNAAPAIAGGMAGMKAGAALGTAIMPGVGTTIGAIGGGLAGMFLGNTAIETGYKGIEAAQDGAVTQDEMSRVKKEGAVKAGVITGVDALTLGLSKAVTNIPARAVESATRNALTKAGVNVADEAAVLAARQSPEISAAVRAAQESAFASANTLGKRAAAGGAALGLETVGEGLGEYLGELAATGKANVADAVLEAMMSLGQSGAEVAWGAARNKKAEQGGMWDTAEAKFQPPPPTLVTEPEPLQQRIDALMGIDTGAMSDKERTQYEKDLTAAFLEPVGVTQDEHGLEIPFTMADYLNAQVRAEDSVRARPLKQNAADQSGNRLQQLADEETQQQPDIPGYVAPEIPVVGTLSAAANIAVQSGAHAATVANQQQASEGFKTGQTWRKGNQSYTIESVSPDGKAGKANFGKGESFAVHFDTEKANGWSAEQNSQAEAISTKPGKADTPTTGNREAAPQLGILAGIAAQAPSIAQSAPNTQPQGQGGMPATAQQVVPAATSPAGVEFDVSKRTNQQLEHLSQHGQPGWKEAAVAEIAKRGAAAPTANSASVPALKASDSAKAPEIPNGDGVTNLPTEKRGIKTIDRWSAEELQGRLDRGNLSPESEQRLRAELAKRQPVKQSAPQASPLTVGKTPNGAEPVTVRNGVVHVGDYPAIDYETEADITVPEGATPQQIADALRNGGALGSRKIFGLKADEQKPQEKPAVEDTIGWTRMTTVEREALVAKAGWAGKTRGINLGGAIVAKQAWGKMSEANRAKLVAASQNPVKNESPDAATVSAEMAAPKQGPIKNQSGESAEMVNPVSQPKTDADPEAKQDKAPAAFSASVPALNAGNSVNLPATSISSLQDQLDKTEPFSEQSQLLTERLQLAVTDDAKSAIGAGEMPVYKVTDHVSVAIHPSAQKEGMIQVTRYTKDGVIGDSQYNSIDEAVRFEGLTHKPRIPSNEAIAHIENSIAAEAEYQKRKNEQQAGAGLPASTAGGSRPAPAVRSDSSLNKTASWVIRNKATGEVVMETYDKAKVDALNTEKYEAVPIQDHLGSLNAKSAANQNPIKNEAPDAATIPAETKSPESEPIKKDFYSVPVFDKWLSENSEEGKPSEAGSIVISESEKTTKIISGRESTNNIPAVEKVVYRLKDGKLIYWDYNDKSQSGSAVYVDDADSRLRINAATPAAVDSVSQQKNDAAPEAAVDYNGDSKEVGRMVGRLYSAFHNSPKGTGDGFNPISIDDISAAIEEAKKVGITVSKRTDTSYSAVWDISTPAGNEYLAYLSPEGRGTWKSFADNAKAAPEAKQDKAPAITPQHVENGESEPATAAVVEQSLMKGAANSPLDLRQERDLLLKKVDSAIAAAPTAEEKDAWNRVEQRIDLTNNMHVADTIGYRIFDVPGDGKFKVLNLKEALQRFRERVETNPGFRKPISEKPKTVADWQKTGRGGTEATVKELLEDGEYSAAVEYAKQIGKPLVFGQYQDGSSVTVYTEAKPFERKGYDDFNMVSVRNPQGADKVAWAVVDLNSGLTISSKHPSRMKAIIETNKALDKTTPEQMATAVRSTKANIPGIVGTQEELEQRWLVNVEQREADAQAKADQEHRSKMRGAKGGMLAEKSVGKENAKKEDDSLAADIKAGVKNANDPESQAKVMADIEAKAAEPAPAVDAKPSGNRRDPMKVNVFNPYEEGDIVSIGGKDWQIKNDGGWYLTTTGNWRGEHPTIKKVGAMTDLIAMVEKAAVDAKKQEETKPVAKEPWMMTLDEILPSDAEISDDGNTGFADSKLYDYGNPDMSKLSDIGGGYSVAPVKGRDSILLLLKGEYRIGVYTGEFGIKAAYRSKGLATKLVKEAMRRGIYTPDESYSVGGAKTVEKAHKEIIREAVSEGKPVPDEVLADYPDLKNATGDAKKQEEAKPVALLSIAGREKFDPISLDTAAGVVARMRQTIKEVWKVDLRLVPTFSALPQEVKDAIAKYGEGTRAKGVLHKGSVYIVADEHASDADVETTILHEIKGHVGLRRLYSDAINKDLGALYMSIGGRRGLADLAKARGFTDELQGYAESLSNSDFTDEERTRIVMEELLSHIAQDPKFGDKVKAIVGKIRAWLRDNGFMALAKFGEADLLNILAKASKALETVRDDNGPVVLMTAWHGSPHDHDKFDSSKIGTGEGAQAYGYGHYFAGAKDVAEWYRRKLSGADNSSITFNGKQYGDSDAANRKLTNDVKKWAEETGRDPERIDVALEYLAGMAGDLGSARQLAAKEGLGISHWIYGTLNDLSEHLYPSPNGRLYQVELAPTADEYLDWDKPLSEQSEFVRNALTDKSHFIGEYLSDTLEIAKNNGVDFNERGDTLYKIVSDQYGSDKAASDYLHSIGIRGIRYLDGSSRSAGEGNSNYVIFNDADVSITAKYNIASKDKLTPADKAIYGMAAEGKSAAEVLKFIASASRSPFNRQVAKLLLKTGIAPSVTVGDGKGWKMNAGEGNKYAAGYNPKTDTISLFRPASSERNMLHELIHAATLKALSKKGMASAQMNALYQHVKKSGKLKGMYGMSDVDEFIAEAFSNPKFQAALKQVAAPSTSTAKSAWHWFVRVIKGILGLPSGSENALSQALEIGIGVMRENMRLNEGAGDVRYNAAPGKINQTDTEAFRKWFGNSAVVDSDGKPLVVYHGTNADFSEFRTTRGGEFGPAIYLTDSAREAGEYGDAVKGVSFAAPSAHIMPVFARIERPYTKGVDAFWQEFGGGSDAAGVERAKAAGYDGIIANRPDRYYDNAAREFVDRGDMLTHYIVFSPAQIKSATGNNGDFDATNPDIRYNVADEGGDIGRIVGDSVSDQLKAAVLRLSGRPMLDHTDPFAAENARLREQDQSLWSKAKKQLRRYLAPGGLLPQSVFAEKIKRDSEFQAVEFDVRHLIGGLEQAVKADFGIAFDKLSKEQMRPITEALAGKVPASLPEATKTAAVAMRQYIDGMSTEYLKIIQQKIDAKMLKALESGKDSDKAQAINEIELFEKIKGNIGRYVHRSYQAFDDPKWFEKVPAHVLNASRLYLKQGYMEAGENDAKASQMAEVTLHEILKNGTAYDSMESFIAESKLGAKDLSVLMRRKEVPAQIRALLGEYPDARLNFTKSATKMGRLIWNTRFLDRVRDMGMGSFFFEGKDRPANATTQIAADGSEVYAPLNGLWTFPEIAQSFKDALGKEQMSDLYRAIVRFNGLVKYGKTVLAPTTAMRNWQSAMFFSLANGHFDLTQMKKSISAFREQVSQKATGQDLKYLRHLKQLGVVYDTPYAGEMARLMEDARMEELLSSDKGDAVRWFRKANQLAQGFYTFGDDFWKIIGFENEKAGLMKAGLSLQEAETEAAKRIRDTYPTYSMVGRGVQWLSRFPLAGTFVSFPAEIIRTSGNMLRTVAADLKSDNPKLRELGMKRAAGMVFVSAAFYSLAALSMAMAGVGDDEDEAIRDLAPEWQKNSTFLYLGRDEKGNLRYFDMSFLDPYGYWKRPITAMLRNQPWEDSLASGLRGMLEPFIGADIAAKAIFEAVANQKENGGKVYKEKDGAINQTIDVADHLRKALQPGVVGNVERLVKAAGDVRKSSGQPYSMEDELVALVGWRATTIDPKTALYYRSFEFTDAVAEARKTITETLRDANEITPEDIADAKARAQAKQEQAFKEMHRLVSAAESAGMSKMQIVQTLRLSNISQANIGSLMRGETPDVSITPQLAARAVRQASQMRGPEYAAEVFDRYRQARAN